MDAATILTLIGALAAVVAVVQTYRANRLSKRIAYAQRALARPSLRIALLGEQETADLMVALPLRQGRIVEFPIRWTVTNAGERSARDVEIFIRLPRELCYGGAELGAATFSFQTEMNKLSARSVSTTKHLETQIIFADTLHPGQAFGLSGVISLRTNTSWRHTLSVKAKDGPMSVTYRADILYRFDVMIAQADEPVAASLFTLGVIDTSSQSAAEYFNEYNRTLAQQKKSAKRRGGKMLGKFRLIEVRADQLAPDSKLPIDRLRDGESVSQCEGIRFTDGYWVPAIGVNMGLY